MDTAPGWEPILEAYRQELYWRNQGEFAIRYEMDQRMQAYFKKKGWAWPPREYRPPTQTTPRASRREPADPDAPRVLHGYWNNRRRTEEQKLEDDRAQREKQRLQQVAEENKPWRFRNQR